METPEIRYARSGGVSIAYQVAGDGPVDLTFVPFLFNVGYAWTHPVLRHMLERLASFARVIVIDKLVAGKVAGLAVNTGARVGAAASPGEVLVSSTVRDLVAGSGISFDDRGEHQLKGVGPWRLYSVIDA